MSKKQRLKANWADPTTTAENEVLPKYLKWAWSSRGLSLAINAMLIMQLTYYCTDILGMKATLVGVLLLASKIFDGITDLFAGYMIDHTRTKYGKARPYEIFIVFAWLLTILLFSAPDIGTIGKSVYVFVLYSLINAVCATFLNGTDAVYLARSIRNADNRVSIMGFNGGIIMLISIIYAIMLPQLIASLGVTHMGWTIIVSTTGIPLAIIGMFRFLFVKELAVDKEERVELQKVSVKTGVRCIAKNKYIWMFAGMVLAAQACTNIGNAVNTYYFKYIVGDIGLASVVSLSSFVTVILMFIFPVLCKKIGAVRVLRLGAIVGAIGYAIRIVGGTNIITILIGSLMSGMAVLPITMMANIYLIDCMDYGEWKTGTRIEGMLNSLKTFSDKMGSGIASGLVGLIMGLGGYDGALAVQSQAALTSIVVLFNYLPMILSILLLILAIIYKLDKELPKIKADLAAKHAKEQ